MDEKDLNEADVLHALENQIDRTYITTPSDAPQQISDAMSTILAKVKDQGKQDAAYASIILSDVEKIVSTPWFKEMYRKSPRLSEFYLGYRQLKGN